MTTPEDLMGEMNAFTGGSDGRYRHPFNRRFIYTEGVKTVADVVGAYWLLDIIATEVAPISLKRWEEHGDGQTFFEVEVRSDPPPKPMTVGAVLAHKEGRRPMAKLRLVDGNDGPPYWERNIDYTDFPPGKWTFYLCMDGIIEAPAEVLVMLLPQEY